MVDPNKLMLLTPGIDRKTGEYLDFGVPATVLANYLREQRIVPEKCDLNSILFLMTPAEDESKLNTLIAKLVKFKNLWDQDAALGEVLPTLYAQNSKRYAGYSLRQVCKEMHGFYREANVKELQKLSFRADSFPELAMSSKDAYEALVANEVDYVPLDEGIKGRISATLALIYPPGIGVVVPGERWDERAQADARVLPDLRGIVQPLPRLQLRSAGRLPGAGRRSDQVPHLRRSGVSPAAAQEGERYGREQKKMNLMQLTFIVAVNMMGSGIIMLPTNMAQVGAISLLSWIVTAVGSMAIAYGFAQAGIFNQRPGGMAAYARGRIREARLLPGVPALLPVARDRQRRDRESRRSAIWRRSSRGCPRRRSRPASSVIALLWLTTVANFGGPSLTGKIGSVTVWGVIIPVGAISLIGWFWFSQDTFAAAWNPQGLSIAQGMGSSISLTLWAFLGMESAAQNSAAVENPKRDVPLACLFGTLGAAVIYVLSTTRDPGHRAERRAGGLDRPVRPRVRVHVQPDRRHDHHGARGAGLPRLAPRLAVHDRADRKVRGRGAHVPGVLLAR